MVEASGSIPGVCFFFAELNLVIYPLAHPSFICKLGGVLGVQGTFLEHL
jgi:hypothetical protein